VAGRGGNTAKAPNENLARELMELFTLGVGHYSEDDVRQAAQALTGWLVNRKDDKPMASFMANRHAAGPQKSLARPRTSPIRRSSICWSRGRIREIPGNPDVGLAGLADTSWPHQPAAHHHAYGPNRDLTAIFRAILADPAFRQVDSVVVKQPIEYVVGALRDLHLRPSTVDKMVQQSLIRGSPDSARRRSIRPASGLADGRRLADHLRRPDPDQARRRAGQGRGSEGGFLAKRRQ